MIFRFIIISDEVDDFMREIQIDSDATFLDFHKAIQESCGYEDGQMTSFTMCENGWEKAEEITLEDMGKDASEDTYVMSETKLSEFLEDEKQHLLYTFDPLADRIFFIELAEIITRKNLSEPKVTRKHGEAPQQTLDFDELMAKNPVGLDDDIFDDDDDDLYGDGIDDIDLEDLDISDGNPYD